MNVNKYAAFAAVALWSGLAGPALGGDQLTRDEAIARALAASPALEAARARIAETRAGIDQAGVKPNPTVGAEVENFTGTGPFTGLGSTEVTFSYAQTLERGGKRGLRTALAREDKKLSVAAWHVGRLDLILAVEKAFIEAIATKARRENLKDQASILEGIENEIRARVKAGRDSELAASNANVRYLNAQNRALEEEQRLEAAKMALVGIWGAGTADFVLDAQAFFKLPDALIPVIPEDIENGPDMALWRLRQKRSKASLALEKARAVQDPTVSVGVRYHQNSSDVAAVAGISIPLALYDTNSGNIRRAKAAVSRSRFERQEVERRLSNRLTVARKARVTAFDAARRLDDNLTAAEQAKALVLERLSKGAASYLDVFAAQSLAASIREQKIDALARFFLAQADIDRLTAKNSIDVVTPAASMVTPDDDSDREGK